jgi:hypothetical protein
MTFNQDLIANKNTAKWVGGLFLISYAGVFIGNAISSTIIDKADYLFTAYPDRGQVTLGVVIELLNDIAVVGIAVLLYPLLRRYNEGVALWYVGLRVLEAAFLMMSKVSTLSIVDLSEGFLVGGAVDEASYDSLGTLALASRDAAGQMGTYAFIVGGVALYYLLLRSELVPRFISIWGLLSIASLIAANLFAVPDLTQSFEFAMLLYFPIVANELFLAGWLLVKGFRTKPAYGDSEPVVRLQERST